MQMNALKRQCVFVFRLLLIEFCHFSAGILITAFINIQSLTGFNVFLHYVV